MMNFSQNETPTKVFDIEENEAGDAPGPAIEI